MGYNINNVENDKAIENVGCWTTPVYQSEQVDVLEYWNEGTGFSYVNQNRYYSGYHKEYDVDYFVLAIAIFGKTNANISQLIDKLIEFALASIILYNPFFDYGQ